MQNYTNLQSKCPVVFFESTEMVDVFTPDTFMMHTESPQTIQISCPNKKDQQHIPVESTIQIKLEKGCKAATGKHIFESGFDIDVYDEIQRWPTIWNISDVLFDVNAKDLQDIIRKLDLIDSKPTPIRDIKKLIWMNTHNSFNVGISIFLIVISVFFISGVCYLIYRFYKVTRQQVPNNVNVPV